jgi:hypothetical protein
VALEQPVPPAWSLALVAEASAVPARGLGPIEVEVRTGQDTALITLVAPGAVGLDAYAFQAATCSAYVALLRVAAEHGHLVRIWNFIPSILEPLGRLRHRYMVFNAGRFQAYEQRYGPSIDFPCEVATASGTGHLGADLVIHALTAEAPGRSVENPRQVPAYRYSERYGPRPPCFARATLVEPVPGRQWLLVGGTASIRGEVSEHARDLEAQFEETLRNLESLVAAASSTLEGQGTPRPDSGLERFRHLRVYHSRRADRDRVCARVGAHFPRVERVELFCSDLCRPELLVEIEGLAEL